MFKIVTSAFAALALVLASGIAIASHHEGSHEADVPGTDTTITPEVQAEIDAWIGEARVFRATTQALTASGAADAESAAYVPRATEFVEFTQARSQAIREARPGSDSACILRGIGLDVTERVGAFGEAADAVARIQVLNGIERLIYEGFLTFGVADERAERRLPSLTRIAWAGAQWTSKKVSPTADKAVEDECH